MKKKHVAICLLKSVNTGSKGDFHFYYNNHGRVKNGSYTNLTAGTLNARFSYIFFTVSIYK